MSVTDEFVRNNQSYASSFKNGDLPLPPAKHVAVLACMDARLDVHKILGLQEGDAHVIRNAGGVATDDAIRSLAISQRLLGTKEIILIHHTDCGMLTFKDDDLKKQIESEVGIRPAFALEAFSDLEGDVKQSIARIKASPFIPNKSSVRGFVYDVRARQAARLDRILDRVVGRVCDREVVGDHHHVSAGDQKLDRGVRGGRARGDRAHLHVVGKDGALEAELSPKHLHRRGREVR
ncbi:MAG: carbonic anhydrase [Chloroflexi bacterium]|nr:MAG: carbonic anhydrase [Chloroflexota bacterium]